MSGHQVRMTHHENKEKNVCEADHYADKSFLGSGHPLLGFVLKIGLSNVWKKLKIKCPDMTNGIDLRIFPLQFKHLDLKSIQAVVFNIVQYSVFAKRIAHDRLNKYW